MGSIFLASIFFLAACGLAYADELRALTAGLWPEPEVARPAPVRAALGTPPRSMLASLVRDLEAPDPRRQARALERLPQYPPAELSRHLVPLLEGPVTDLRDRVADLLLRHGGEDVLEPLHRYFLEREEEDRLPEPPGTLRSFPVSEARDRATTGPSQGPGQIIPLHRGRRSSRPLPESPSGAQGATRGPQAGDVSFPPEVLSPEPELRAKALSDLSGSGHPHAQELLCRVVTSDPDALVRGVAAAALGRLPDDGESQAALARATRDEDPSVRWNACYALGKLGSRQAKRALRFAENDADGSVRLAARKALEALGLDPPMPTLEAGLGLPS